MAELTDAQIGAALERGKAERLHEPRAAAARYDPQIGSIIVELTNGCTFAFPPRLAQGLETATADQLAQVEILGTGYGLHWEALDVDLSILGLLAGLFGTKAYMARHAGQATSPAKAAAARTNGAKGGRPRKAGLVSRLIEGTKPKPRAKEAPIAAKVNFFPLGNADTMRLDLADGRKVLIDYADMLCRDDPDDLRCDLPRELRRDLARTRRNYYDAVCITHIDSDHCKGFGDFFWLEHAKPYQDDERIRTRELWVPADAILEEGVDGDAQLVRAEARHRFRAGKGIRVFSRPARLKEWMDNDGLDFESRKHLIVDAGQLVPGYAKEGASQAEFFVHSPFGWRQNEQAVIDHNEDSIAMQVTFREGGNETYVLLGADLDHESLSAIVRVTRSKGNDDRLLWDLVKLLHHCSYLSLGPDRGTDETKAVTDVKWLFETQGRAGGIVVSPSWPIPVEGSKEDDDVQPPHRQAANYYRRVTKNLNGQFTVTMEHPSRARPVPFGFEITSYGVSPILTAHMVSTYATVSTPGAG